MVVLFQSVDLAASKAPVAVGQPTCRANPEIASLLSLQPIASKRNQLFYP